MNDDDDHGGRDIHDTRLEMTLMGESNKKEMRRSKKKFMNIK